MSCDDCQFHIDEQINHLIELMLLDQDNASGAVFIYKIQSVCQRAVKFGGSHEEQEFVCCLEHGAVK